MEKRGQRINCQVILEAIHELRPGFKPGCDVANGKSECTRGCGGRYLITESGLIQLIATNSVPSEICGKIEEDVKYIREIVPGIIGIILKPQSLFPQAAQATLPQTG